MSDPPFFGGESEDGRRKQATLGNQFVTDGRSVYQIMEGTGMGQINSGLVPDLAFWQIAEKT